MKEKKYFCDYWEEKVENSTKWWVGFCAILLVAGIIIGLITYSIVLSEYKNELTLYEESMVANNRLEEIVDEVIKENEGINLSAIPKDVAKYDISKEDNKIIFTCSMNNAKDTFFISNAKAEVILSEDYKIISKEITSPSEEEFINEIMESMKVISIATAVGSILVFLVISYPFCLVAVNISNSRKWKDDIEKRTQMLK